MRPRLPFLAGHSKLACSPNSKITQTTFEHAYSYNIMWIDGERSDAYHINMRFSIAPQKTFLLSQPTHDVRRSQNSRRGGAVSLLPPLREEARLGEHALGM